VSTQTPNQPPRGVIDEPRDGTMAPPTFRVRGWAGDDRGIKAIRVLVDGELAAMASFTWERPDVSNVFPHFRHGNDRHGWETTVDGTSLGLHAIQVEAIDTDGVASDLGTVWITVLVR
jgi:N-acetylmuramoyl-L-alanine amidase